MKKRTDAEKIERVLGAGKPVTIDEICLAVYGYNGPRQKNAVHQRLYRLAEQRRIRKHATRYELIEADPREEITQKIARPK